NRHGDASDVDFLERVGTQQLASDLSRNANDWGGIEHGRRNAGDHVRCAWARSCHCHANPATCACVTVCHVRRALLMPHNVAMQFRFAQRVIDRQNRTARITKDFFCAEMFQRFAKYFRTSEFHTALPGCTVETPPAGTAVTAPSEEDETSSAYLAITPFVKRGAGSFQVARRRCISSLLISTLSSRLGISKTIVSPSCTAAIGPRCAASGATWPAIKPCVAPENLPSVRSATESPSPCPTSAAVTASISRMPGPPLGPS